MQKVTSSTLRSAVRQSTQRRLFSTAVAGRAPMASPLARVSLLSLRSISSCKTPAVPRSHQRWYSTGEDKKEADSEVSEEDSVQEAIKKVVAEYPCVIFMKGTPDAPQCGFSNATIKALNAVGAEYEAFDVLQSPALRDGVKKFSDWPTIPQVFVGGEFVGGCDITLQHLRSGELTTLLEKAGALKEQK